MIEYTIYSPSYKRSDVCITHKLFEGFDNFYYVVRQEEEDLYKKHNIPLKIIPKNSVKDIATTRNYILKNRKTKYIIMVDDDIQKFEWNYKRQFKILDSNKLKHIFNYAFEMAESCNAGLWGMNLQRDPKLYRTMTPFSFSRPVLGPFVALLDDSLEYDESLPLKEDYDFFIQQMNKYRKALRFNFLSYLADHYELKGGCQTYRTRDKEIEQNNLLIKKWGSKIIKSNFQNEGSLNMNIQLGMGI